MIPRNNKKQGEKDVISTGLLITVCLAVNRKINELDKKTASVVNGARGVKNTTCVIIPLGANT